MPERESGLLSSEQAGGGRGEGGGANRAENLTRLILVIGVVGLATVVLCALAFVRTGAWQVAAAGGAAALTVVVSVVAWRLAGTGRVDPSAYVVLLAAPVAYLALEAVLAGATPFLAGAGALLIVFVGTVFLRDQWRTWLSVLLAFLAGMILLNVFEPMARFPVSGASLLSYSIWVTNGLLALFLLAQVIRAYSQTATIRVRLLMASVAAVALTAAAISAGSILIGIQNGRQQAIDRLELVATLRGVQLDTWLADVKDTLAGSLQQAPEYRFVDAEMANVVAALIDAEPESQERQDAYDFLAYNFDQWLKQGRQFEAVFFMDRHGNVLVSTEPSLEGQEFADREFFNRGTVGAFLEPPSYSPTLGRSILYASRPILGEYGRLLGVVAGRVNASTLDRVMRLREKESLGETGESYLVGTDRVKLTESRHSAAGIIADSPGVAFAIAQQQAEAEATSLDSGVQLAGTANYQSYTGVPVIGYYRWLPDLEVAFIAEQSRAEALRAVNRTAVINGLIALVSLGLAGAGAAVIAGRIGDRLSGLAETASAIAAGDLEQTAEVGRDDEIGTLAAAFNTMTTQLRDLIGELEQRVAERTAELETRSAYLEASAEVGRAASTVLEADALIQSVVDLVHDRFDLYYVGLFLIDETGQWADLRAGTGQPGREMLAQGHRLMVGGDSMIGQCVARREARIALDVGEEAVRFDNPLLPETRSEAALPLRSRGRMLGAISVQSERAAAFDEQTVTVLQTMADQVAVALDNAYLFAEAEESLQAARRASAELSREGWSELLRYRPVLGYHSDERGVIQAETVWRPEMEEAVRAGSTVTLGDGWEWGDGGEEAAAGAQPLAVPIKVAGEVIGVLDTHKPREAGPWTDEEVEILESLVDQMAVSLESARLYQETQSRAAREQMVAEITSRLWASLDPDTILKTTVRELGRALDAELASVELRSTSGDGKEKTPADQDRPDGEGEG